MNDVVLIHGAWHGAGHLAALAGELTARGHRVLALDLLGHGTRARFPASYLSRDLAALRTERSPLAGLSLDEVAADVVATLRRFPEPPVVAAHSMGGTVATRVAELAPELVAALVYITAFVPTTRGPAGAYLALPEAKTALGGGLFVADPGVIGAVRLDPRSTDPAYQDELHAAYFSDLDRPDFEALAASLTPDQPLSFLSTPTGATAGRWGSVPRTYIRTLHDRALPIELQDVMIRDADELAPVTAFTQVTLHAGHAVFAAAPAGVAEVIGRAPGSRRADHG
ncbi:alpha/beta hydrolase [Herbidospora yilanensis]|uniref:alpha/beta hydrolase n=1 Tax=Herbidospora yilanensis TaxID=354426 RepID=UPI000780C687|nr:alpha/beta fold hydrolase [Herbidospora yilanensis]